MKTKIATIVLSLGILLSCERKSSVEDSSPKQDMAAETGSVCGESGESSSSSETGTSTSTETGGESSSETGN